MTDTLLLWHLQDLKTRLDLTIQRLTGLEHKTNATAMRLDRIENKLDALNKEKEK